MKRIAKLPIEDAARHTKEVANNSYEVLQEYYKSKAPISVRYLEAIAKARYVLSVVAENLNDDQLSLDLHHIASTICTNRRINTIAVTGKADTSGPVVYLLKLLVRQYGFPRLKIVSQAHPWIIPQEFKGGEEVNLNCVDIYPIKNL